MIRKTAPSLKPFVASGGIGYGPMRVRYASGREVDWMKIGFSPRKANLTLYVLNQTPEQAKLLEKLGKHKTGKGCLYVKRLSDVDEKVLEKVVSMACKKFLYS